MLTVSLAGRDLLRISDLVPAEADAILDLAVELRAEPKQPLRAQLLYAAAASAGMRSLTQVPR